MATMQELTPERGGRKQRKQRRRRRKHTLLNRIFNHSLSFAVASQSFTMAQERRRKGRTGGGEGEKQARGRKIGAGERK